MNRAISIKLINGIGPLKGNSGTRRPSSAMGNTLCRTTRRDDADRILINDVLNAYIPTVAGASSALGRFQNQRQTAPACILLAFTATPRLSDEMHLDALASDTRLDALVQRVRAEFLEMPGLRLTPADATRLWGLCPAACTQVIDVLIGCEFLRWTPEGMLARVEERVRTEKEP